MSSDSELSFSENPSPQNSRLQSIWNSIKETKELGLRYKQTYNQDKKTMPLPQHLRSIQSASKHSRTKDQSKKYKQDQAIDNLLKRLHEVTNQNQVLTSQIKQIKDMYHVQMKKLKNKYENKKENDNIFMKQNVRKNSQGSFKQIQVLNSEISHLNLKIKSLQYQNKTLEEEVQRLNSLLSAQQNIETQQLNIIAQKQSEASQLLDLNEARQTINRLVQLLRKTQEYKQFANLLQQTKGMHYLKNVLKRFKKGELQINQKNCVKRTCGCIPFYGSQKILWSPTGCYKTMLEMKIKYDYLSQDCIQQVLFQINRLYSARQQQVTLKIKEQHKQQISKWKKKVQESYNQIIAKKQITRLKKQLSTAKSAKKSKNAPRIQGLKHRGQFQDHLHLKQRELRLLRQRVKLFQTQNIFSEKALYYQGILWTVDKLLGQVQNSQGFLKNFEISFRQKLQDCVQVEDWMRAYKQFFELLSEQNGQLIQKLLTIKENTLKKTKTIK